MGAVTPGKSFGTTEEVTTGKLRQFVELATAASVNWSEVDPSLPRFAVVSDTTFSLGPEGSLWFDKVERALMVMSRWGPVALAHPTRMETRRFPFYGSDPLPPGRFIRFNPAGGAVGSVSEPAIQLAPGTTDANMASKVLGVSLWETAVSGAHPRICHYGVCKMRFGDHTVPDLVGRYGGGNDGTGVFSLRADETTDRACAVVLGRSEDLSMSAGDVGVSTTGWVFFWPGNSWVS